MPSHDPAASPAPATPPPAPSARRRFGHDESAESAADYVRYHAARADRDLARHEIRSRGERSWLLQRLSKRHPGQWDSTFAAEVVALGGWGRLLVHGDLSPVIFSHSDSNHPRRLVDWIGGSDVDYATRKAADGFGPGVGWRKEPEVARHELPFELDTDHEEEDREQAVGGPGGQAQSQMPGFGTDRELRQRMI